MRVMVLDGNTLGIYSAGILRTEIIGMQVVRNDLRLNTEDVREMLDPLYKRFVGFRIAHIPNMMAEERITIACQTKGVPAFASYGKGWLCLKRQIDRIGRIPARAAQIRSVASIHPDH